MKAVLALFVLVAAFAVSLASYSDTDGKPICTEKNVAKGEFRNNFDPTRYWVCNKVNEEAQEVPCPGQTGYQNSLQKCVSWDEWVWEPLYDPPTE